MKLVFLNYLSAKISVKYKGRYKKQSVKNIRHQHKIVAFFNDIFCKKV